MNNITNFEAIGLDSVEKFLKSRFSDKYNLLTNNGELSSYEKESLKQLLLPVNISFCLEHVSRLITTLLCELKLSYTQQSQRYVNMVPDEEFKSSINEIKKFFEPVEAKRLTSEALEIYNELFTLYNKMSETKDNIKGRPKPEDYKYGIPIEDARYILPLSTKNNITISMNGSKLIDLFELFNSKDYYHYFTDIMIEMGEYIPATLYKVLRNCYKSEGIINLEGYYGKYFSQINSNTPIICINDFEDGVQRVAIGAWTSSMKSTPSELIEKYGDSLIEKENAVINRVLGYGHHSIIEHYRNTFGYQMSLTTYHQFVRHRLNYNYVQPLYSLLTQSHDIVIPKTIQDSPFAEEYMELATRTIKFRKSLPKSFALNFLLNCEAIKVISSTNARNDCRIMYDRVCKTAQWEIRDLYSKKLDLLYKCYPEFYKYGLPPCVNGGCKEGSLSCGKPEELREKYKNI